MKFDPLYAFSVWFLAQPLSLLRPPMYGVHHYGDICSVVLYRDREFQVELFIVAPDPKEFTEHGHPDVDSMEVPLSGELYFNLDGQPVSDPATVKMQTPDGASALLGSSVRVLPDQAHGAKVGRHGGSFLSIQHWKNGVAPTSVGLNWSGPPHNQEHKERYLARPAPANSNSH